MIIKMLAHLIYEYHLNDMRISRLTEKIHLSTDLEESIDLLQKQHKFIGQNELILKLLSGKYDSIDNAGYERVYNRLIDNIEEIISNEEDFRDISINELKSRSLNEDI